MEQIDALYATNLEEGPSNVPKAIAISTSFNLGYVYLYGYGAKQAKSRLIFIFEEP